MNPVLWLWLAGCNRYALFVVEDGRDKLGADADVLFVLDNSESMREESVALVESFVRFVDAVASFEAELEAIGDDGLEDAVAGYIAEAGFAGGFVDLHLAVTSIDAAATRGALLGEPPVLAGSDPDLVESFVRTVVCEATCFVDRNDVPTDPEHRCADGFKGAVTREYLDCACGVDEWLGHCGASVEEGLESAYLALCRTESEPPVECFEGGLLEEERDSSPDFRREGATYLPIVITDEGDQSHRLPAVDPVPELYDRLFTEFGVPTRFAVVAPELDASLQVPCAPTVASWGISRYDYMVEGTGGLRLPIYDDGCGSPDWATALEQIGAVVNGTTTAFELEFPAVPASIAVEVGERRVPEAEVLGLDAFEQQEYSDGWFYVRRDQTVYLHGSAVPGPDERVRIWYLPDVE